VWEEEGMLRVGGCVSGSVDTCGVYQWLPLKHYPAVTERKISVSHWRAAGRAAAAVEAFRSSLPIAAAKNALV